MKESENLSCLEELKIEVGNGKMKMGWRFDLSFFSELFLRRSYLCGSHFCVAEVDPLEKCHLILLTANCEKVVSCRLAWISTRYCYHNY